MRWSHEFRVLIDWRIDVKDARILCIHYTYIVYMSHDYTHMRLVLLCFARFAVTHLVGKSWKIFPAVPGRIVYRHIILCKCCNNTSRSYTACTAGTTIFPLAKLTRTQKHIRVQYNKTARFSRKIVYWMQKYACAPIHSRWSGNCFLRTSYQEIGIRIVKAGRGRPLHSQHFSNQKLCQTKQRL